LANIDVEALVNDCEEAEVSGQERPFATVRTTLYRLLAVLL